jgi:hypothetical protein
MVAAGVRRLASAALTAFAACVVCTGAAHGGPSGVSLTRFSLPDKAGSIRLPSDWRFKNASYPSDHSTWFWYDPNNSFAKLRIVASGCIGCVSKNADAVTSYPRGDLPANAIVTASPSPYTILYRVFDTPYQNEGRVVVLHDDSGVTGSDILDLWLPAKKSAEAARILASFQP